MKFVWFIGLISLVLGMHCDSVFSQADDHADLKARVVLEIESNTKVLSQYPVIFSGSIRNIPESLSDEILRDFPEYTFWVGTFSVLIDAPYRDYDMILVTEKGTGKIKGNIWVDYSLIAQLPSFRDAFSGHKSKSRSEAIQHAETLAKLIVSIRNEQIGVAENVGNTIRVPLLRGGVSGYLVVKLTSCDEFDEIFITDKNGILLEYKS